MNEFNWPIVRIMIGFLLVAFLAVYVFKIRRELKSGYPLKDERTERITGKAAMGTYYVTLFFILILLFWMIFSTEVPSLPEIDTGYTLIAVMMVMGFSFGILSWLYARKEGQIEDPD